MLRNFFPILLVIFLTCSGCVRNPGLTTPQTGERLSWVAEEALVERLEGEATKLSSVRGLSRSRIEQNEERVALRHVIAYQQPDKLRIETLPSNVVQTLQLLILDGEEAIYLDASSKQGYRGPADSGLLRRFFGIALAPSKLMSLLSGRVPLESLALETKIFLDKNSGLYRLECAGGREIYYVAVETLVVQAASLRDVLTDKLALKIDYSSYGESQGIMIPRQVDIEAYEADLTLTFRFTSYETNGAYSRAFEVPGIPDEYKIQNSPRLSD